MSDYFHIKGFDHVSHDGIPAKRVRPTAKIKKLPFDPNSPLRIKNLPAKPANRIKKLPY